MGGSLRCLLVAAGLACFASPVAAQGDIDMEGDQLPPDAQPPPDAPPPDANAPVVKDPKVAKTWLTAGDTLVKKGDQLTKQGKTADAKTSYENAVTAYQKAIEASEDATAIQLQLAIALDKAGDTPGALKALKIVIAAQATVKADLLKKAQTKLDELSMKVGVLTLTIVPEGTAISIDGKQVGEAPMTEALVLMPGSHTVSLAAVGYQPKDVELKIEAGSESERKIELEAVPITTKPDTTDEVEPQPVPEGPAKPSLLPIYVGGGVTAGLFLIGTVTGIAAVGKAGQYEDSVSENERKDIRSSGKSLALVTDLCFIGALGAAGFTAYWYWYKYRPVAKALAERQAVRHSKETPVAKVDVLPWVQSEVGGLMAVGSF